MTGLADARGLVWMGKGGLDIATSPSDKKCKSVMSAVVNGNVLDLQLLLDASNSMVGECKGLPHSARLLLNLWQALHAARARHVVVCCLVKYDQCNYIRRDLFCHIHFKYTV